MNETMTKLGSYTVPSGGVYSVTFSNIPQGYTDLKIVVSARDAGSNWGGGFMWFNGSAPTSAAGPSNGYSNVMLQPYRSTHTQATTLDYLAWNQSGRTTGSFAHWECTIFDYTSNNYKNFEYEGWEASNDAGIYARLGAGLYSRNLPITSVSIGDCFNADLMAQYSTFTLYGIKSFAKTMGNSIKASGGDIVTSDGTYVYHAFLNSGAFKPTTRLLADVLVIAGGAGGAGGYEGGGGGAGGVQYLKFTPLNTGTSYTCTIGAGGSAGTGGNGGGSAPGSNAGGNGNNSYFAGLVTAIGGGGGGAYNSSGISFDAQAGGSGGGASRAANGGAATAGVGGTFYGNAGGNGNGSGGFSSSGGGGAGSVGGVGNNSSDIGGNGGNGLNTWSAWASATNTGVNGYYAGGGAGSAGANGFGGLGGGGAGGVSSVGGNGVTNTGSGGGGVRNVANGGSGGSGIIIVRYKA
jgi:hypothetical protein